MPDKRKFHMRQTNPKQKQILSIILIIAASGVGLYFYFTVNNTNAPTQEHITQGKDKKSTTISRGDVTLLVVEYFQEGTDIKEKVEEYREKNGMLMKRSYYDSTGEVVEKIERYGNSGALASKEWYVVQDNDTDTQRSALQLRYVYRLNNTLASVETYRTLSASLLSKEWYREDQTKAYKKWYREDGSLLREDWYREDETKQRTKYYRADEVLQAVHYYYADNEVVERAEEYRENGTVAVKEYYNADGVLVVRHIYDENGNRVQR